MTAKRVTLATTGFSSLGRALQLARTRLRRPAQAGDLSPYLLNDIGVSLFDAHAALDRGKALRRS